MEFLLNKWVSHAINKYKYNKETWRWWAQNVCFVEAGAETTHGTTLCLHNILEASENYIPNHICCICGDDINFWSWKSFTSRTIFKHAALEGNKWVLIVTFLDLNLVESLYRTLQRFGEPDLPLYIGRDPSYWKLWGEFNSTLRVFPQSQL